MRRSARLAWTLCLVIGLNARTTLAAQPGVVLRAMQEEVQHNFERLCAEAQPPPYFLSYAVEDKQETYIDAAYGSLRRKSAEHSRLLDISVRVGDYELDNTHRARGDRFAGMSYSQPVQLPIDDDAEALKAAMWLETDRRYKAAADRLIQVRSNRAVKVQEEDLSADFSKEKPARSIAPLASAPVDSVRFEGLMRELSALLTAPGILEANATFTAETTNKLFASSEGALVQEGSTHFRISLNASAKAADGMDLFRYESFDAHAVGGLPDDAVLKAAARKLVSDVLALRDAPVVEPFTGPAILSGRAAGVFFHEIFGHRIEGSRQKDEQEGQTFTKKIGQPILPDFLSVVDDPTAERFSGTDLNGYYLFDDEGVKAERVVAVDQGILRNFLMSRSPVASFTRSNGHGRASPGGRPIGRQGNLIVQAARMVSEAKLREMLIDEAKRQGKPFGLVFTDISGGFTQTGRSGPQAFQVTPILVYRVYVDGRPDELVRGVDLIGTPLAAFSKMLAASDRSEVFNGHCGAESGWVPVSAVSPSLLTAEIEVQKREKSSDRPPLLPAPLAPAAGTPAEGRP